MNTAQKKAQTIAQQIAQEPLEILKNAREQVSGTNIQEPIKPEPQPEEQKKAFELQDKMMSARRMEAYQRELIDIRKEEVFKDLQRRISLGEDIPLENYTELTMEQKQVLKAQMEAVAARGKTIQPEAFQEPAARKGRRLFNFGKKQEVKRQQTRVENIVPPSG